MSETSRRVAYWLESLAAKVRNLPESTPLEDQIGIIEIFGRNEIRMLFWIDKDGRLQGQADTTPCPFQ